MRSIRTKYTLLTVCAIIVALIIATVIGVVSIKNLGNKDAEQMLSLVCTTGAKELDYYFEDVEGSIETTKGLFLDWSDKHGILAICTRRYC